MSIARKLLGLAVASAVVAASLAASTPATARPSGSPESFTLLTSGSIHVTTTTGKHLRLELQAIRFAHRSGGSNADRPSTLSVFLHGNHGHETHRWTFALDANSFTDTAAANGHLGAGAQIAPFGRLALTMSPLSRATTQVCTNDDRNIVHRVALKGTLSLRTHSTGWGAVASRSVAFTHGRIHAGHGSDIEEACAQIPCEAGVTWTASHGTVDLNGDEVAAPGRTPTSRIEADRFTKLASPAHAARLDTVTVSAPAPQLSGSGKTRTLLATSSDGIATGSATLTSTRHGPYRQDCVTGTTIGTEWTARYATPKTPLTLHEQIFGPLTIDGDKNADFLKVHVR